MSGQRCRSGHRTSARQTDYIARHFRAGVASSRHSRNRSKRLFVGRVGAQSAEVDAFLEERSKPAGDYQQNARVKTLQNAAICATEANLQRQEQLIPANREKIADARRLARQALETKQGQAETAERFAWDKYKELFALKRTYEARLKNRQGEPPTDRERETVAVAIREAKQAAETNLRAWVQADNLCSSSNPEPYGDHPRQCATRRASAEETVELVSQSAKDANRFIAALDQRAAQRTAGNR